MGKEDKSDLLLVDNHLEGPILLECKSFADVAWAKAFQVCAKSAAHYLLSLYPPPYGGLAATSLHVWLSDPITRTIYYLFYPDSIHTDRTPGQYSLRDFLTTS